MPKKKEATISIMDVAKEAGVSLATTSRALNDSPLVKQATKKRVREVAARLGYELLDRRPGPRPGGDPRKKQVAFIKFMDPAHYSSEIPGTHFALKGGVMSGASENDFSIHEYYLNTEAAFPESIENGNYAGFLLVGSRPNEQMRAFLKTKPCCWLMSNPWRPDWGDHVMPDHREAGVMAAQYLLRRKVKHPAIIKLGLLDQVVALRQEGFFYHLEQENVAGVSVVGEGMMPDPDSYPEAAYVDEIVGRIKELSPCPDGFFMDCDQSLSLLYPVLVSEGLIRPGKTQLIGCNNQRLFVKGINPCPATMDIHYEMIGMLGVSQLAWRIKHREQLQRFRTLIAPSLVALL